MKHTTAFSAREYDKKIKQTLPYYEEFYKQIIDVVKCKFKRSVSWLDVGCGTGKTAEIALNKLPIDRFVFCDNSLDMLDIAKSRFCSDKIEFMLCDAINLEFNNEFDVVTAVQVFHYLSVEERKNAIQKCYEALNTSGIFITFENFAPDTETGKQLYLDRWKQYQLENGKNENEVYEHIARYGKDYFPITIDEHKKLMRDCGFDTVELLYCSYMQAGLLGIK